MFCESMCFNFDIVMDRSEPTKIVNGVPASAGEFPYMVNADSLFYNHYNLFTKIIIKSSFFSLFYY